MAQQQPAADRRVAAGQRLRSQRGDRVLRPVGFVIAFGTDTKERTWPRNAASRLSRGYHALEVYKAPAALTEQWLGTDLFKKLTFANLFLGDYLLALLVFCNFAGMRRVAEDFSPILLAVKAPVRWAASHTFTLYLLHQPVLLFWAAVIRGRPDQDGYWWSITVLMALTIVAVGYVTENRREGLRTAIQAALERAAVRLRPGLAP